MEYEIFYEYDEEPIKAITALERVVRKAITEGWEPQGNAQLTCCIMTPGESDRYMCIQAMVRKMK